MKISLVTPSFNQAPFIEQTLQSVQKQTGAEFEHIVVDACSTDGTRDILENYRDKLDRLIIEPDGGQADAIRKGFAACSGEILGFLNSDDVLLPGTMKFISEYFADNPSVDAVYSNRIYINEDGQVSNFWILPPHSDYLMSRWDFVPQETCFWRRSLMERSGGIDPTFRFALDYDLFVRMMAHGRFRRVNRFLAAFRLHPNSKSTTLYDTVGRPEITQIQRSNGINIHWYDHALKYCFGGWILGISFIFRALAINAIRKRLHFQ